MTVTAPTVTHTHTHTGYSHGHSRCSNVWAWLGGLTSGHRPGDEGDVAPLKAQAEAEEVPQLVVAGEVDDGGGDGHHSAQPHQRHTHNR